MFSKSIASGVATTVAALALTTGGTLLNSAQPATAVTITENTINDSGGIFFPGQSVTTANSSLPWNTITFNWFSDSSAPTAFGDLFLLSQEYLGTPAGLSAATTGFLAQSQSISSNQYIFDPSVTLQPNTQYFFYANASGRLSGSFFGDYPGGNSYFSFNPDTPFAPTTQDVGFRLSGEPIPTPALLPGLIGMGVAALRKRKAEAEAEAEAEKV